MNLKTDSILWLNQISHDDIALAGGKGANLGEMYHLGIPVPNGFVVTSNAYFNFLKSNHLPQKIKTILDSVNVDNPEELNSASNKIKTEIRKASIPPAIADEIMKAYKKLSGFLGLANIPVAVRSSATAEDLPSASFAGQQETFLNVIGESNVVNRVRDCWASLFTPRAIFYRHKQNFDHFKIGIAVPVQKLIDSKISGIVFSVNPVSQNKNQMIIEAVWGLGEYIVQGVVTPDQYLINKTSWQIESATVSAQTIELVRSQHETKKISTPKSRQNLRKLNSDTLLKIAKIAQKLQNHYHQPQDIEFAIDSKNQLYIVQTRPITTLSIKKDNSDSIFSTPVPTVLKGDGASPGVISGPVSIVSSASHLEMARPGSIMVTSMTTPDFVPAMKRVAGIITDQGGQTSHAAIISRELGVPCVVGARTATKVLKNNQIVTLNGKTGEVWLGDLTGNGQNLPRPVNSTATYKTATKLYVNLAEPEIAASIAAKDVDGIGLLRAEFIVANIGLHPKKAIANGHSQKYIHTLAQNILKFCRPFNPRPVIYRANDFKTNEYRHLKWGKLYEPIEPNPMLGFRGASRYLSSPDVFQLELEAIKIVRHKYGLKNLHLMIPFVRTVDELLKVKKIITDTGLIRSPSFKLYLMVEIPSNVILLEQFASIGIDGISIGSNDLTMLTLGLDRDNQEVAQYFDELNPAVLWMIKRAIKKATKLGLTSSICGQAPSNHSDLVEKLVKWGISSISVSPDTISHTREIIHWAENKLFSTKKIT